MLATGGVFFWALFGKIDVPLEQIEMSELQAIEDMLIAQGWEDLLVSTARGYFGWEPYGCRGTKKTARGMGDDRAIGSGGALPQARGAGPG